MKEIGIGLLGCGVVGSGIVEVLEKKAADIEQRLGTKLEIKRIAVRDIERDRHPLVDRQKLCTNWLDVCTAEDIDVVIEVVGGTTMAKEAVFTAIRHGKSVITANKELMARHGQEIRNLATKHDVSLRYEASVLAGIPVIHTLQSYFNFNRVQGFRGIFNGTSNYILTRMYEDGVSFPTALEHAQQLGYAEADPAMDIDGIDAWCKLQILLDCLGFDHASRIGTSVKGIRDITAADMQEARAKNCKFKHVVSANWNTDNGLVHWEIGLQQLTPADPLYHVDDVQNALCLTGDIAGEITLMGPGAGAYPTTSAILEDLLDMIQLQAKVPV